MAGRPVLPSCHMADGGRGVQGDVPQAGGAHGTHLTPARDRSARLWISKRKKSLDYHYMLYLCASLYLILTSMYLIAHRCVMHFTQVHAFEEVAGHERDEE